MCMHCSKAEMHGRLADHHKIQAEEAGRQGEWDEANYHSGRHKHHLNEHHREKEEAASAHAKAAAEAAPAE